MTQFDISFVKNEGFQARLCNAETAEQAQAYFESLEPQAVVIGVNVNNECYKPGKPCETVPEGWTAAIKTEEENNMTNTISENQAHCKHIADTLEQIAENSVYECPECGEFIQWNNDEYNTEEATYTCPHCNKVIEENELEAVSMLNYFQDCLDIEYRVTSKNEYKSVQVMVACGGPNIYVDTKTAAVELYWWGDSASWQMSRDSASWQMSRDTAIAIDEAFEELFECGRA